MVLNKKSDYWSRTENLEGKPILLSVRKYQDETLEIVINYVPNNSLYRKEVLIILIVFLNLILLIFEIISTNYCIALFIMVLLIIYNIAFTVKQEKILIVESLGYQIEVHYGLGHNTRYIAWQRIKSVIINEVVSKQRVIFILALLTKETSKEASTIIPLFTETMPRLLCLEAIYQYIEHCHE